MSDHGIDYEKLAREALRNVVRAALERATEGLPGEHHFFITVQTTASGVEISEGLRAAYPEEITIVIQHQFIDLIVEPDRFAVTLFFANTPERLTVPYSAISRFYDPSVPFGLIFDVDLTNKAPTTMDIAPHAEEEEEESEDESEEAVEENSGVAKVVSLDQFRKK